MKLSRVIPIPVIKPRIGLLSTFGKATHGEEFLANLVNVQGPLVRELHVISSDLKQKGQPKIFFYPVRYEIGESVFSQLWNQATSQFAMSYRLVRLAGKVDFWVFFGGDTLLLPMLTARLLKYKVMLTIAGNLREETRVKKSVFNRPQLLLQKMCFALSSRIVLYSECLVRQWQLDRYRSKIIVADHHFLDLNLFKIEKPLAGRSNLIGYIGRLSPEKGVRNFIKAMPLVLAKEPSAKFIIIGNGPLLDELKTWTNSVGVGDNIIYAGRVPRSAIPGFLNEMKLCVLPSFTEGMPNVVLEAMACGTPVLATPVGAVPDLIVDNTTGFIIKKSSPEGIALGIIKVMNSTNLENVAKAGRRLIEERFTIDAARQKYEAFLAKAR